MNQEIKQYLTKYPDKIQTLYFDLDKLIIASTKTELTEKFWAKIPSYYHGENFVRLIPFKDHINIEAKFILQHKNEMEMFKITPKGMLQLYPEQDIPADILSLIFKETLLDK